MMMTRRMGITLEFVGNNKKGHILLKYNSYEIFVITIQNIKQNGKNKPQNTINTTQKHKIYENIRKFKPAPLTKIN